MFSFPTSDEVIAWNPDSAPFPCLAVETRGAVWVGLCHLYFMAIAGLFQLVGR
jgi:hypothetical protein